VTLGFRARFLRKSGRYPVARATARAIDYERPRSSSAALVDAMSIFTFPVVLGGGKKLFADGSTPHSSS